MAYIDVVAMARSQSLLERVAACAAAEGVDNPWEWAVANAWTMAASPGWAEDWRYAVETATPNVNPDTGARGDVIDDSQILPAVQALLAAQNPA